MFAHMLILMCLIVAVDKNWAIGKSGQLLIRNKYDLEHFKSLTIGNIIVYGRKTLETFPDKKPLPDRTNIVLTRDPNYAVEGAIVAHSLEELEATLIEIQAKQQKKIKVFVCGGASIYEQLLPYCEIAYVTHFDAAVEGADAFFPNLSEMPNWHMVTDKNEPLKVSYKNDDGSSMSMAFATWLNDNVD